MNPPYELERLFNIPITREQARLLVTAITFTDPPFILSDIATARLSTMKKRLAKIATYSEEEQLTPGGE
tara:strand:- start:45 stop:251 length:207 start_codon:yes stop_codon:yes gene_type:complete